MKFTKLLVENKIEKMLSKYINLPLECDGLARVITYVLEKNNIKHKVCVGNLSDNNGNEIVHYWIELPNKKIIDYRAQMWLGKKNNIPNGIFNPKDYKDVKYDCRKKIKLNVNDMIFKILIGEI